MVVRLMIFLWCLVSAVAVLPTLGSALCSTPATITTAGTIINTNVDTDTYNNRESCLWTITAPEGYYPTITFSSFATEPLFDEFRVYDGSDVNSPIIFSESGLLAALETVTGSQSTMTVTFTSDDSTVSAGVVAVVGFSEQAGTVSPPPVTDPVLPTPEPTVETALCSTPATITTAGTIINTNVDTDFYSNNQSCLWTITAPEGFYPTITFSSFSTEGGADKFCIYDGSSTHSRLLFCRSGYIPPSLLVDPVTISQSTMTVTFTSDRSFVYFGVVAVVGFSEQAGSKPRTTKPKTTRTKPKTTRTTKPKTTRTTKLKTTPTTQPKTTQPKTTRTRKFKTTPRTTKKTN